MLELSKFLAKSWVWWYIPILPAFGQKQDCEFEASLGSSETLSPTKKKFLVIVTSSHLILQLRKPGLREV
jgi:hypothetical protein